MSKVSDIHTNKWKDSEIEKFWDSIADIYVKENDRVSEIHDQRFVYSIDSLNLSDNHSILNISSRDAGALEYFNRKNLKLNIVNSEIAGNLLEKAKKNYPEGNYQKVSTYSQLPFEDSTFDKVLTLETLEHCEDPVAFLNELHRVTKDSARMVLSCPPATAEIPYQVYSLLFGGHGEGPHRFLRSNEVKVMFEKTNWKLLEHKGTLLFPFGPSWFQKFGEKIIEKLQKTFVSEFGIRQFYVCEKV